MSEYKGFRPSINRKSEQPPSQPLEKPDVKDRTKLPFANLDKLKAARERQKRLKTLKNKPPISETLPPTEVYKKGIWGVESYVAPIVHIKESESIDLEITDQYWTAKSENYTIKIHHNLLSGSYYHIEINNHFNSFLEDEYYQRGSKNYTEFIIIDNIDNEIVFEFDSTRILSHKMWLTYKEHLANGVISVDKFVQIIQDSRIQNTNQKIKKTIYELDQVAFEHKAAHKLADFSENYASTAYTGYQRGGISVGKEIEYWLQELPESEMSDKLQSWVDEYYLKISEDFINIIKQEFDRVEIVKEEKKEFLVDYFTKFAEYEQNLRNYNVKRGEALNKILEEYDISATLTNGAKLGLGGVCYSNQNLYIKKIGNDYNFYPENYLLLKNGLVESDLVEPEPPKVPKIIDLAYSNGYSYLISAHEFSNFNREKIFDKVSISCFGWQHFSELMKSTGLLHQIETASLVTDEHKSQVAEIIRQAFNIAIHISGTGLGINPKLKFNSGS
jgi:hypothetical protein